MFLTLTFCFLAAILGTSHFKGLMKETHTVRRAKEHALTSKKKNAKNTNSTTTRFLSHIQTQSYDAAKVLIHQRLQGRKKNEGEYRAIINN